MKSDDAKRLGKIAEREYAKTFHDLGYYVEKWPDNPGGFDFWCFNVDDYNNSEVDIGGVMVIEVKANPRDIEPTQECAKKIFERKYGILYKVKYFGMGHGIVPAPWMWYTNKNYKLDYPMHNDMRARLSAWKEFFYNTVKFDIKTRCKKR